MDKDYAVFGEVTFDITEKLSATGGVRFSSPRTHWRASSASVRMPSARVPASTRASTSRRSGRLHGKPVGAAVRLQRSDQRRAVPEPRQGRRRHRQHAQREPDLQIHRPGVGLCHLLRGVPPRRRQSRRQHAALPGGLAEELRGRLEDDLGRQSPALQRRDLPGGLGRLPVFIPRSELRDDHRERRQGEDARR